MTTDEGFPDTTDPGPVPPSITADDVTDTIKAMALTNDERASVLNFLAGYNPRAVGEALDWIRDRRALLAAAALIQA